MVKILSRRLQIEQERRISMQREDVCREQCAFDAMRPSCAHDSKRGAACVAVRLEVDPCRINIILYLCRRAQSLENSRFSFGEFSHMHMIARVI